MSDPVLSVVLSQIATILQQQIDREVRLVAGVEKELKKLETELMSIKAVIVDAERRQVKEELIKVWIERLKDVAWDAEDVLCEWITATKKAQIADHEKHKVLSSLMSPWVGFNRVILRHDIGKRIKEIKERLAEISKQKKQYELNVVTETRSFDRPKAASYVDETQLIGRASDSSRIIKMLLSDENPYRAPNVLSIIGMGGIGKTTVAQMVYKDKAVVNHFESRVWVCVTDLFDDIRIGKAIIEDLEGHGSSLCEVQTVLGKIRSLLKGKKLLLVLDDVWTEDFQKWQQLFNSLTVCAAGSVVIVTTQKETVANAMGSRDKVHLGQLSADDSWSLFKKFAFVERSEQECPALESVGQKLAYKCKGLPFSLKTIASLVRFKKTENDWLDVLNSEFWEPRTQGLFPPLMLSYYDLPSPMRQCFLYCAFFPKDHVIEADNLVKLWMAQGSLISSENVEMETLGREFVENLAMRSFFQDIKKDRDGKGILSFKMHNMVHDFALYLNRNDFSAVKITNDSGQNLEKVRHLVLIRSEDTHFPDIRNSEKLASLWVQAFHDSPRIVVQTESINPTLFLGLNRIKSLDLSRNMIGELPKEIGKLMKLRYLNLSHNPLVELPPALSELFNLQTLKLDHCYHLKRLPSEMRKLINLRHLEISHTDSLKALPKGTGLLVSLQTLSKFIIVQVRDSSVCGIEDLHNIKNLRGCLKIEGLGYVSGATEARKAELKSKIYLSELQMDFSPCTEKSRREDEVIQALVLHENLQSLQISSYGGSRFPYWFIQLKNLRKLHLQDCRNCSDLPPLGRLPSLTDLQLGGLKAIKFLKIGGSGATSSNEQQALFPKLKKLKILKMENWEDWQVADAELHDGSLVMFPCLRILKILHCVKVKALPTYILQGSPIEKLRIQDCPFLKQKYNKRTGEHWSQVSHIPKCRIS